MKKLFNAFFLLLALSLVPVAAQEWSQGQNEVLQFLNEYTQASMRGDVDEIMEYFQADFLAWVYSEAHPFDRDSTQGVIEYNVKMFKQVEFDIQPVAIQLQNDMAIAHLNFQEIMRDGQANEMNISGRWTATLVKQGNKWVFLCWTWVQELT